MYLLEGPILGIFYSNERKLERKEEEKKPNTQFDLNPCPLDQLGSLLTAALIMLLDNCVELHKLSTLGPN